MMKKPQKKENEKDYLAGSGENQNPQIDYPAIQGNLPQNLEKMDYAKKPSLTHKFDSRSSNSYKDNPLLPQIKRNLGILFKNAYEQRISIDRLYEKGQEIRNKLVEQVPEFFDRDTDKSYLKEAIDFIDSLHDKSVREHNRSHNEEVYYHMRTIGRD